MFNEWIQISDPTQNPTQAANGYQPINIMFENDPDFDSFNGILNDIAYMTQLDFRVFEVIKL